MDVGESYKSTPEDRVDVVESYKSTPEDRVDVGGDIRTVEMTGTALPRRSRRPLRRSVKGEVAGEAGD